MTRQDKKFFTKLTKNRAKIADALEDPSVRGFQSSVVDKYSDQAHFIYELLQNADDAFAEAVKFVLEEDRLIFSHDGSRHFSISDPDQEREDSGKETLGDINAITSIGNSNKTTATIGKFGVGFKAVFQYTNTPYIYDKNFCFKIERFIVPVLLEKDFPKRSSEETLFVFPFNVEDQDHEETCNQIIQKLSQLSYPLLFLSHVKSIKFSYCGEKGSYQKLIEKTYSFWDTTADQVLCRKIIKNHQQTEHLWLFTKIIEDKFRISSGFFLDEHKHLKPVQIPAFCFFPTKEKTGLNFIIHAPFLLTESRESIFAGNSHNELMIQKLAELSANALIYLRDIGIGEKRRLIDDSLLSLIPYDPDSFTPINDRSTISFMPFFTEIQAMLKKEAILPTENGYVHADHAYWPAVSLLTKVFGESQLKCIVNDQKAEWVFISKGRESLKSNHALTYYIDMIVKTSINEDAVLSGRKKDFFEYDHVLGKGFFAEPIKGITSEFIEVQDFKWLHTFYKWLSETQKRKKLAIIRPFFLDKERRASALYADKDKKHPILFKPVRYVKGYAFIEPKLLKNEETLKFLEELGLKEPSTEDYIFNVIKPLYEDGKIPETDRDEHFRILFKYANECSKNQFEELIELIRPFKFLCCYSQDCSFTASAGEMYFSLPEVKDFLRTKKDALYIDYKHYQELIEYDEKENLKSFLSALGVRSRVSLIEKRIDQEKAIQMGLPQERSTQEEVWREFVIDGCQEMVEFIVREKDRKKSEQLWVAILEIIEREGREKNSIEDWWHGKYEYFFRQPKQIFFDSTDRKCLKDNAWLIDDSGNFKKPTELFQDTLSLKYDTTSEAAKQLMNFLGVQTAVNHIEADNYDLLPEEVKDDLTKFKEWKAAGIDFNDKELLALVIKMNEKLKTAHSKTELIHGGSKSKAIHIDYTDEDDEVSGLIEEAELEFEAADSNKKRKHFTKTKRRVVRNIMDQTGGETLHSVNEETVDIDYCDQDEWFPIPVDYNRKIKRAEKKMAEEIDRITYYDDLQQKALRMPKYSYAWFNTLLEMESINKSEGDKHSREVKIIFGGIERETGTQRTFVLKYPDRYIPQFMEDLMDIPLVLNIGEQTRKLIVEAASVRSYTLRIKVKTAAPVEDIDLKMVTSAVIEAKSPAFLLDELRKQFSDLNLSERHNMQTKLCKNIEFIFGPPGTGKTTYLAKNVLISLMHRKKENKVLVLTPTNKSADVLVKKIMEVSGRSRAYQDWLVRFGITGDEAIEKDPVFRDKTFDIRELNKNVTVTTIARFPYDFFMPAGERIHLHSIDWDYIVIDEASMIPLAQILLPLYKMKPKKFIIAGDPFQIAPIASVNLWKDENIYTMVKLDSFANVKTFPHDYKVELLTTQYRSLPAIGDVFSQFAYDGILRHFRNSEEMRVLDLDDNLKINTLNIIKFPVSKYESIYRSKRLQHSSAYQIYSALFSFEFVNWIAKKVASGHLKKMFKIGIITPYRAQADMIDKLFSSVKLPKKTDVQVGTIHGFQGDECDMIFFVLNTPPNISSSSDMFLNKKNILNVAVSRAKDYLFILMPDDETENIDNLGLVREIETLCYATDSCAEFSAPDLEQKIFGDSHYLENNTFSTSHQNVNVYGLPEKRYEIRTEETAVDVQIHRKK